MYKVIGADQKHYGPVPGDLIRQWIAEGRLDGHSQVCKEDEEEWKPLSGFAEFADALGIGVPSATPPPLVAGGNGRAAALRRVKAPAIALVVSASLDILLATWGLLETVFFSTSAQQSNSEMQQLNNALRQLDNPQIQEFVQKLMSILHNRPIGIVSDLFGLAMSVLILMGALKMKSLRSYEFSITAAILSMVPCVTPCCFIGLPFGIWALIILRTPEVKSHFH